MIDISEVTDWYSMLGIISHDADSEKTFDFTFIDHFDFLCKFRDDRIAGGFGETADEDIVDVNAHDYISSDVNAWIGFESLKSHTYNNFW